MLFFAGDYICAAFIIFDAEIDEWILWLTTLKASKRPSSLKTNVTKKLFLFRVTVETAWRNGVIFYQDSRYWSSPVPK